MTLDLSPLERDFGPIVGTRRCPSTQGEVWRVEFRDRVVAVKVALDRERDALLRLEGLPVPRIVAELPGWLVLSWIDGEVGPRTAAAHEEAGRLLRRIHEVAIVDDDPVPIAQALAARIDAWTRRAQGRLAPDVVDGVRRSVDPARYRGCARVLCHRDFTADNWILGPELHAIDFGQARPDLAAWDLVKAVAAAEPVARARFLAGYGETVELQPLVVLHGLQTAVWGIEHGDAHVEALGRAILQRWLR